jgi:hypothetical protein
MPKLIKTSIELGRSYKGGPNAAMMPDSPESEGVYVTLPDISGLKQLPESGEITFHYCRKNLNLNEDDKLSAQICLCRILSVKADPEEDGGEEKTDDVVDKLFEAAQQEEAEGNKPGEADEYD